MKRSKLGVLDLITLFDNTKWRKYSQKLPMATKSNKIEYYCNFAQEASVEPVRQIISFFLPS